MNGPSLFDLGSPAPPAGEAPDTDLVAPPFGGPAVAPAPAASGVAQTQSLYRKYRPQTFGDDDLVGQEHVVRTLQNAIALGRVAHAYLFCGPRGTGKTTTARLLAKAVNCLDPDPQRRPCNVCASCVAIARGAATDIVEIDAASNRGIDDIRDLRERVKYAPTQLRTKFYIVDEAHQITGAAANAFLKTLEEPPAHTKFVLATTDPEELLPTIVSRCQRFDFRRISVEAAVARLRTVALAENIAVDDEALTTIARAATGSLRDALGLLDQLAVYRERDGDGDGDGTIDAAAVRALLGVSRNDRVEALVAALADRDPGAALGTVNAAVEAGEDPRALNRQLVAYLRVLLHERAGGSPDADERARQLAARFELVELADLARRFGEIDYKIRHAAFAQLPLEVALVDGVLRPASSVPGPTVAPRDAAREAAGPPDGREAPRPRRAVAAADGEDAPVGAPPEPPPAFDPVEPDPAGFPERVGPAGPSLRDRVRNPGMGAGAPVESPGRDRAAAPNGRSASAHPEPPMSPPAASGVALRADRQTASSAQPAERDPAADLPSSSEPGGGALTVDRLADLWPRIRQDVKAINRRIEAVLSSVDPVATDENRVTLAAAYDFHRKRLSEDDMRRVVEDVISRLVERPVTVVCVLRGALPPPPPARGPDPAAAPASRPAPAVSGATAAIAQGVPVSARAADHDHAPGAPQPPPEPGPARSPDDDARIIQAAKNIFDAEEVRD